MKAEIKVSHDSHMTPPVSNSAGYLSSTPHTPTSARKKKAVFEARTRQQLEAEAEEFKRQKKGERNGAEEGGRNSSAKRLDFSSSAIEPPLQSDLVNEVEKSLTVLPANSQGYVVSGEATSYKDKIEQVLGGKEQKVWGFGDSFFSEVMSSAEPSVGRAHIKEKQQSTKRVHFSPEALVLPAALDGELDTVQHCVQQVGMQSQHSHSLISLVQLFSLVGAIREVTRELHVCTMLFAPVIYQHCSICWRRTVMLIHRTRMGGKYCLYFSMVLQHCMIHPIGHHYTVQLLIATVQQSPLCYLMEPAYGWSLWRETQLWPWGRRNWQPRQKWGTLPHRLLLNTVSTSLRVSTQYFTH